MVAQSARSFTIILSSMFSFDFHSGRQYFIDAFRSLHFFPIFYPALVLLLLLLFFIAFFSISFCFLFIHRKYYSIRLDFGYGEANKVLTASLNVCHF